MIEHCLLGTKSWWNSSDIAQIIEIASARAMWLVFIFPFPLIAARKNKENGKKILM